MKKLPLLALLFLPAFTHAQTAAELEAVFKTGAVSYSQAAYFVLHAAGCVPSYADYGEAFRTAAENKWLPRKTTPEKAATLGGLSLLVMKSFNFRGGVLYTLFSGARYSFREMVYKDLIQGRSDPGMRVSGERLLRILGRALIVNGEDAEIERLKTLDELNASLQDDARRTRGVSSGAEDIQGYDNQFQMEGGYEE